MSYYPTHHQRPRTDNFAFVLVIFVLLVIIGAVIVHRW
ncbi:sporulation protein YjcZ [Evansella sp. AB-P1]|nr:sporulation protein YjcZ [Evansella sp. AB-P1]MDG5789107.1 sporulation protein YjcZ [Evansella sp. AB-P1]